MLKLKYVLDISDSASRARQRLAFSGLSFLILFFFTPAGAILGNTASLLFMVALGLYFVLALVQSWLISNRDRHWVKIEMPSYCIDLPLIAWGLVVAPEYLSFISPLISVVALIRGIRYGPCMLACHIGLGISIVVGLALFVPYWQAELDLVYANLFLLLVLPVQFYGVSMKIQASSKSLRQENLTDPLTRSLNRKALEAAVWRMLNAKEPFVLSFLDLDNFKMVNDTMGHATGDKLLKRVSTKLSLRLRAEDTVYRLSGDEFVVLSLGTSRADMAENLGQRIRAAIADAIQYTCPNLPVSASVGVLQVLRFDEVSLEKLLSRADELMYQAKRTGKNQVLVEKL
ncbi:MAG: GGDEF domain-containing protein [Burkholderiales bacterium]|jgi:diguanylate cyclase (GGDEF)-like protein|uniref:GGDEF domain-containing protein n=1 Tax=Limnobacter sp. TaxID=2003368 RepID=UPI0039BCCA10|nr:GGDEF domain-containing protein [Burkholderiales bacterium]